MSANTILANINEIAFALACFDPNFTYKIDTNKVTEARGAGKDGVTKAQISGLVTALQNEIKKPKVSAQRLRILIKIKQAKKGVEKFRAWLNNAKRAGVPVSWKRQSINWSGPLKIAKAGWTCKANKFTTFLKDGLLKDVSSTCGTSMSTMEHNDNPSDVVVIITDESNNNYPLGISLKATFSKGELTIYNGGICATLFTIVYGKDVAKKKSSCSVAGKKLVNMKTISENENNIKSPYKAFLEKLEKTFKKKKGGVPPYPVRGVDKKKTWWSKHIGTKDNIIKPKWWNAKLAALSAVRDQLYDVFLKQIGAEAGRPGRARRAPSSAARAANGMVGEVKQSISAEYARNILAGIIQFTHANITAGQCDVPYVKLTGFLNSGSGFASYKKKLPADGAAKAQKINEDITISIKPPDLSKFIPTSAPVPITIAKISDVSIYLKIGTNPPNAFNIRVKLESKPPSGIKIDIKPVYPPPPTRATKPRPSQIKGSANDDEYKKISKGLEKDILLLITFQNIWEDVFHCEEEERLATKTDASDDDGGGGGGDEAMVVDDGGGGGDEAAAVDDGGGGGDEAMADGDHAMADGDHAMADGDHSVADVDDVMADGDDVDTEAMKWRAFTECEEPEGQEAILERLLSRIRGKIAILETKYDEGVVATRTRSAFFNLKEEIGPLRTLSDYLKRYGSAEIKRGGRRRRHTRRKSRKGKSTRRRRRKRAGHRRTRRGRNKKRIYTKKKRKRRKK